MSSAPNLSSLQQIAASIQLWSLFKACILVLIGFFLAKSVSKWTVTTKLLKNKLNPHQRMLLKRTIFYVIFILFFLSALQHMGFSLSILLGATGFLTLAVGFASQTSVSNLISGLFLIIEKPFVVGDWIQIDSLKGQIISLDALSIKLCTSQNTLVRIPNETLIKSNMINLSRFPLRRFDLEIGVSYEENLEKVKKVLLQVAENNTFCLKEKPPVIYFLSFGDSAINLQFFTWATQDNFDDLRNTIPFDVKIAFDKEKIDIPFPTRTLFVKNKLSENT